MGKRQYYLSVHFSPEMEYLFDEAERALREMDDNFNAELVYHERRSQVARRVVRDLDKLLRGGAEVPLDVWKRWHHAYLHHQIGSSLPETAQACFTLFDEGRGRLDSILEWIKAHASVYEALCLKGNPPPRQPVPRSAILCYALNYAIDLYDQKHPRRKRSATSL